MADRCFSCMLFCMRTTLDLDDALMKLVRRRAADAGTTITAVIEEALREALVRRRPDDRVYSFRWVTTEGRLRSGVDLNDRDALYDAMEGSGEDGR